MLLMWTANLNVGVKSFDDDHRRLIRMINELHGALLDVGADGKIAEEEIEISLHRLENYFKTHCAEEEKIMVATGYPDVVAHKAEHAKFFEAVAQMQLRFRKSTNAKDATEIMQFMCDWATHHIFVMDRKYTSHLNSKGVF